MDSFPCELPHRKLENGGAKKGETLPEALQKAGKVLPCRILSRRSGLWLRSKKVPFSTSCRDWPSAGKRPVSPAMLGSVAQMLRSDSKNTKPVNLPAKSNGHERASFGPRRLTTIAAGGGGCGRARDPAAPAQGIRICFFRGAKKFRASPDSSFDNPDFRLSTLYSAKIPADFMPPTALPKNPT